MHHLSMLRIQACCRNTALCWLFICGFFYSANSLAGQATLEWDTSPSPGVNGYRIYYGFASHNYTVSINAGNQTQYTVPDLQVGRTYYFAVTAYINSPYQESGFSNEVIKTILSVESLLIDGFD